MPYKDHAKQRECAAKVYARLKKKLFDLKGGVCAECGAHHTTRKLEVHHTAEDGKNRKRKKSRYKEYRRLLDNPEEYELLCRHPCHLRRTMAYVRSFKKGGIRAR